MAAWLDLSLSPLTADPRILGASYLNCFPAKPLQFSHKYSCICTNRIAPLHCWVTATAPHSCPPRVSFQCLASAEWAGRSSLCSAWGSWGHYHPLCVATHYVIGTTVLKTSHASNNKSMFYSLDEQMQPFEFENSRWLLQSKTLCS